MHFFRIELTQTQKRGTFIKKHLIECFVVFKLTLYYHYYIIFKAKLS